MKRTRTRTLSSPLSSSFLTPARPAEGVWERVIIGGAILAAAASGALAGPENAQVVQGQVNIARSGANTTITASHNSIINYGSFDIRAGESVQFIQPGAMARVLNRIDGAAPTRIDGLLRANGQVYFVNPAGVMFGQGALIDCAGIYAAGANITNQDFLNNVNRFTDARGAVINRGTIQAGSVALIGTHVANHGLIVAPQGTVVMAAGNDVYIGERAGTMYVRVDSAVMAPQAGTPGVENTGRVEARRVNMAAGDMYSLAIRNSGTVKAQAIRVEGQGGGRVEVGGTLDASNAAGRGGDVRVLGEHVELRGAAITATGSSGGGTVLVGGEYQGGGTERRAQTTTVDAATTLEANSTGNGDAGTVVAWSDGTTRFEGTIRAQALGATGKGGTAEISGKEHLSVGGHAYLHGAAGEKGTLLLDPGSVDVVDGPNTAPGGTLDTFNDGWVIDQLDNGGADLTISTADSTNGGSEILTVQAAADIAWNSGNSLTLIGNQQVVIDGTITNSGFGGLTLMGGDVDVNNAVTLAGGAFTSTGGAFDNTGGAIGTGGGNLSLSHAGDVTFGAAADAGAGSLSVRAEGNVNVNANLSGGTLLSLQSGADDTGDLTIGAFNLDSAEIRLRAGDGPAGPSGSVISLAAGPTFRGAGGAGAPGAFSYQRDADIVDAELPAAALFQGGSVAGIDYAITSDAGSITIDTASKVAGTDLSLSAIAGIVTLTPALSLASINANGFTLQVVGGVTTTGAQTYTGALNLLGNLTGTGSGAITINGPLTLAATPITIATAGAAIGDSIIINQTVDGASALTLNAGVGAVSLVGDVGGLTPLLSLAATGSAIAVGDVRTVGAQSFTGATTLNGDLTSSGPGTITIGGPATLGAPSVAIGTGGAAGDNVIFTSTVDGAGLLTVSAGSADVSFGGAIGGTTAPATLIVTGANIAAQSIRTVDILTLNGVTTLDGDAASDFISFNNSLILGQDITIAADTATFTASVDSEASEANDLTVNAATTAFAGPIGSAIGGELGSLTTDGVALAGQTSFSGGLVRTTGAQTYNDALSINSETSFSAGGPITFNGQMDGAANIAVNAGANATFFNSPVGSFVALGSGTGAAITLNSTGPTTFNSSVNTVSGVLATGPVIFTDTVTLGDGDTSSLFSGTVTLDGLAFTAADGVTFGNDAADAVTVTGGDVSIAATNAPITFVGALDGAQNVTLTAGAGAVTFTQATGALAPLLSLTVTGSNTLRAVTTTGSQSYTGTTVLQESLISTGVGDIAINGAATLNADITVSTAAGDVVFGGGVNSDATPRALTVNTGGGGDTVFGGQVGAAGQMASLTTNADGSTFLNGSVLSAGAVVFNDAVLLQTDLEVQGTTITFGSTIDSESIATPRALTLNTTGGGLTLLGGQIGLTNPLLALTTNSDGTTQLNGLLVRTTSSQTYNDPLTLANDVTMTGNAITFNGVVNSDSSATPRSLTIATSGNGLTRFAAAVGATTRLNNLVTNDDGTTQLAGGVIQTVGDITLGDAVTLQADTTLEAQDITFRRAIDSDGTARGLIANSSGSGLTSFNGNVGGVRRLSSLTTNADGTTRFAGTAVRTSVDQVYGDDVVLANGVSFTGNDITFQRTVNSDSAGSPRAIAVFSETVGTDQGETTFVGHVGRTARLLTFGTNDDGVTKLGGDVLTVNFIEFQDVVSLLGDSVVDAGAGTVFFRRAVDTDASTTGKNLTVLSTAAPSDNVTPIRFGASVGASRALLSLTLGGNLASIPGVATIAMSDAFDASGRIVAANVTATDSLRIIATNGVTMGVNQKLTAFGALVIDGGTGTTTVGDLVTLGDLTVNGAAIQIRARAGGPVLTNTVSGGNLVTVSDPGVDIVAGGGITFNRTPTVIGAGATPRFVNNNAAVSPTLAGFPIQQFTGAVREELFIDTRSGGDSTKLLALDLFGQGPTNTNLVEAFAGPWALPGQIATVAPTEPLSEAQREALALLGIVVLEVTQPEARENLRGRSISVDAPATPSPDSAEARITESRLSPRSVDLALAAVEGMQARRSELRATIGAAWERYTALLAPNVTPDPLAFRAYAEVTSGEAKTVEALNEVREALGALTGLGLSPAELRVPRMRILSETAPESMSPAQLGQAAEGRRDGEAVLSAARN